jgi:hypothetical protein
MIDQVDSASAVILFVLSFSFLGVLGNNQDVRMGGISWGRGESTKEKLNKSRSDFLMQWFFNSKTGYDDMEANRMQAPHHSTTQARTQPGNNIAYNYSVFQESISFEAKNCLEERCY